MQHQAVSLPVALFPIVLIVVLVVGGVVLTRRNGYTGQLGRDTIVRCRAGHLFTTIWVPFVSFKSIRLGMTRFQRCPVGNHLTFVVPVNPADLTEAERRFAAEHHDRQIP